MKLFDRFDEAFCINLDRRPDRLTNFDNQVKKLGLGDYTRVSAIDGELLVGVPNRNGLLNGELGLILTLEKIITKAIENSYETILIMEDDCLFSEEILNLESYFEQLPLNWDLLYMGGNHNLHVGAAHPIKVDRNLLKLHHTFSAHFVGIKKTVFHLLKNMLATKSEQIDVSLAKIQKTHHAYCFFPTMVKQYSTYSDIQNKLIDYNWLIK